MAAKLILNIAVSLDGYIADKAGGYAWITGHGDAGQNTKAQFSFDKFLAGCGTVVMGRKAYEECGIRHIDGWQEKRFFVASHRPRPADAPPNVEFFCGGLAEKVEDLKRCAQGGIWLFGGGQVASALISASLVDEAVIGVLPVILAAGCFRAKCPPACFIWRNVLSQTALPCCAIQTGAGHKTGPCSRRIRTPQKASASSAGQSGLPPAAPTLFQ